MDFFGFYTEAYCPVFLTCKRQGHVSDAAFLADAELIIFVTLAALLSFQELVNLCVVAWPLRHAPENVSGLIMTPVNVAVKGSIATSQSILEAVSLDHQLEVEF